MSAHIRVHFRCDHYDHKAQKSCQQEGVGVQEIGGELRLPPGWKAYTYHDYTCQCDITEHLCEKHKAK